MEVDSNVQNCGMQWGKDVMDLLAVVAVWVYVLIGGLVLAGLLIAIIWILRVRRKGKRMEQLEAKTQPSKVSLQKKSDQEYGLQFIQESGEVIKFTSLSIVIGQSLQNDIVLSDKSIASQHARVYYDQILDAVCVEDLTSDLGIMIDDLPTRKNILHDGNCLQLGTSRLIFRDTGYIHSQSG